MEQQLVLLATNRHDGNNEPAQQWMTIQIAGAFLASQWLPKEPPPKEVGTCAMSQEEWDQFTELLWKYTKAIGWSKWDYRSEWYVREVLPIGAKPPELEPPTMAELDELERQCNFIESLYMQEVGPLPSENQALLDLHRRQIERDRQRRLELDERAN